MIFMEMVVKQKQSSTLLHLCMEQASRDLLDYAETLHCLPVDVAEILLREYLGRKGNPGRMELEVMLEAFCDPKRVSLMGVYGVNTRGLMYLPKYASGLIELDLSGCSWLDSLGFLPELVELQSLGLRGCWRLTGGDLRCIQGLPKLQCVDLENVFPISDNDAAQFIRGMTSLQALNMSGTGVADGFVDALTYGCKLRSWDESNGSRGVSTATFEVSRRQQATSTNDDSDTFENLLRQWPPLQIKYLRLQRTMVTQAAISSLLALKEIMLLDLRTLNVTRRSLVPLQAKYGLVTLPNNSRLMARSNTLLAASLGTSCGCHSLRDTVLSRHVLEGEKIEWNKQFEQRCFMQLLRVSSSDYRARSRDLQIDTQSSYKKRWL